MRSARQELAMNKIPCAGNAVHWLLLTQETRRNDVNANAVEGRHVTYYNISWSVSIDWESSWFPSGSPHNFVISVFAESNAFRWQQCRRLKLLELWSPSGSKQRFVVVKQVTVWTRAAACSGSCTRYCGYCAALLWLLRSVTGKVFPDIKWRPAKSINCINCLFLYSVIKLEG
jgi:hypothetical protein